MFATAQHNLSYVYGIQQDLRHDGQRFLNPNFEAKDHKATYNKTYKVEL
jgi:hypothetical protein